MTRVRQEVGRGAMRLVGFLALLCLCSGCPNASSPAEEKIPSRWIRIEPADESPEDAVLTAADVERLKATVPTIMKLVAERQAAVAVTCDGRTHEIDLCATSPDMLELLVDVAGATVSEGRFLTIEDNQQDQSVIVLTQAVAEALFVGTTSVGQEVTIDGEGVVVVGTLLSEDRLVIRHAGHEAYVPVASPAMAEADAVPAAEARVDRIWVSVRALDDVSATREVISATLKQYHADTEFRVE